MRRALRLALLAPLLLPAACEQQTKEETAQQAALDAYCRVDRSWGRVAAQTTKTVQMWVKSVGKTCYDGIALNGGAARSWTIEQQPQHGKLEVFNTPGASATVVAYRPVKGYAGKDALTVTVNSPSLDITYNFDIDVVP